MSDKPPFVHFLLPYYGPIGYFQETVRSVLTQESGDWRLTVVDDQSPFGDVRPWLDSLNEPRISYLRNEENLGLAKNFQRCLSLAQGDYAVFLGDDDRLLPQYTTILHRVHNAGSVDIFQPTVTTIDDEGQRCTTLPDRLKSFLRPSHSGLRTISGDKAAASLLHGNWTYFPSIAWNVEKLEQVQFNDTLLVTIDLGLMLDLLASGAQFAIHNGEPAFEYRRHAESVSSQQADSGPRFSEEREFFSAARKRFQKLGWRHAARAATLHWTSRAYALLSLVQGGMKLSPQARKELWRSAFGS